MWKNVWLYVDACMEAHSTCYMLLGKRSKLHTSVCMSRGGLGAPAEECMYAEGGACPHFRYEIHTSVFAVT